MHIPKNEILVLDIAGSQARLATKDIELQKKLIGMGFISEGEQFVRPIINMSDRKELVKSLIAINALFSGGKDWSPAELADMFYEQGEIPENYRKIVWKGPDKFTVIEPTK